MLNSEVRVYNFKKFSWRERAPVPLADACYARPNIERESFEGEKFCGFVAIRESFSAKFWGAWRPLEQQKRAIRESFLRKNRIFHQFAKVLSLESFPPLLILATPLRLVNTFTAYTKNVLQAFKS